MCNVPAPLRRRHDGGTGTPPFSRLRCSAARAREFASSPSPGHRRAPSNPRWCNTQRLLCDITRWARASDKRFTVTRDDSDGHGDADERDYRGSLPIEAHKFVRASRISILTILVEIAFRWIALNARLYRLAFSSVTDEIPKQVVPFARQIVSSASEYFCVSIISRTGANGNERKLFPYVLG